jgi:hypothetical protein
MKHLHVRLGLYYDRIHVIDIVDAFIVDNVPPIWIRGFYEIEVSMGKR